jgi:predicted ArsR family transcriptional regulator
MINSRQKILNYIIEEQCATVNELSRVFKVTQANIRHHLSILYEQGSVIIVGYKPAEFKGRPSQIYSATRQSTQNNLDAFIDALLANLSPGVSADEGVPPLKVIAAQMVSKYPLDTSNPTRRLYSSIRLLNQMNYHAHWEAHVENPHIMLDYCPYRSLIKRHPELCQLDRYILEQLLSAPVEQIEKESPNVKGLPHCVFILKGFL